MNGDQLHRSTLGIYTNLVDDFNPSVQKLVSLGDNYIQAFKVLAATSEAYYCALSAIGEKAYRTTSSHSLGHVLIQIHENHKRLIRDLDGVFRSFSMEVLGALDNNTRLDKEYLSGSRTYYEVEVRNRAAQERTMWRGNNQGSEYVRFLRDSNTMAREEEERRYRFLAEKHCGLIGSVARLINALGASLQQKADTWTQEVNATRQPEVGRPRSADHAVEIKSEEIRHVREELPLGKIPSRAPSPVGSVSHATGDSLRGRSTKALGDHQPAPSNPTLLPFTKGDMVTVLVDQPRNGWLFGRVGNSSRQGWFPASYVEVVDAVPLTNSSSFSNAPIRNYSSNSISSMSSMSSSSSNSRGGAAPPPPPPPPSSSSSSSSSSMPSNRKPLPPPPDRRGESNSEVKRPPPRGSRPELFPRGTNPFATVKLKPTHTNDRSAPKLYR